MPPLTSSLPPPGTLIQFDGVWPLAHRLVIHDLPPPAPMDVLVARAVCGPMRRRVLNIGNLYFAAQQRCYRVLVAPVVEDDGDAEAAPRAPKPFLKRNFERGRAAVERRHMRAPALPMSPKKWK